VVNASRSGAGGADNRRYFDLTVYPNDEKTCSEA
jgi:hypothetical protein